MYNYNFLMSLAMLIQPFLCHVIIFKSPEAIEHLLQPPIASYPTKYRICFCVMIHLSFCVAYVSQLFHVVYKSQENMMSLTTFQKVVACLYRPVTVIINMQKHFQNCIAYKMFLSLGLHKIKFMDYPGWQRQPKTYCNLLWIASF